MRRLLRAAERAGVLRGAVEAEDLVGAVTGFCLAGNRPDWRVRARRLVVVLVEGLRP